MRAICRSLQAKDRRQTRPARGALNSARGALNSPPGHTSEQAAGARASNTQSGYSLSDEPSRPLGNNLALMKSAFIRAIALMLISFGQAS